MWLRPGAAGTPGAVSGLGALVSGATAHDQVARLLVVRGLLFLLVVPMLVALAKAGRRAVGSPGWLVATATVGAGLLRTPGLAGHASEGVGGWLGSVADMVHLLGIAVWLGGLLVLCAVVLPRRRPEELSAVVPRYSSLAMRAMAAAVAGGAVMSWRLVGGLEGLTGTPYGHVLLVKLVATAAILVAARSSRSWVEHRLEPALAAATSGASPAVRPFAVSVAVEATLAIVALGAASVLVGTSPGR